MSGAVWPATLPPATEIDQYQETLPELAIRSETEAGPAKVRRRYSAGSVTWQGTLQLSQSQTTALEQFWAETLGGGALAFEWFHPRTAAPARMRFLASPAFRHLSGPLWLAELRIEILP